ncbi:MAG: hypothetical protein HFI29_09750 [Lachnospiraceae bacterium]|jgi:hypothetical protein|nr:hypothetical protein [Lachnospiraceae bacterium]
MYTLVLLLLAAFSLYIGAWAFVRWDASWLRGLNLLPVQILIIALTAIFLLGALLLILHFLKNQEDKTLKRLAFFLIALLGAGQLIFLLVIQPMLRYDPLKVFDMAVEMLRTHTISGTYETGYFARYTNNYPITILTYWFLLLLSKCGLPESLFLPAAQLLNIACITGSIWLGYLILKELKNLRTAVFYLILCALCPLSYVWAGYFYTATLSMPCLMGILYLYLRLTRARTPLSRTLLGGALGLTLILGYKLRATAMIAMIAIILHTGWKLLLKLFRARTEKLPFSPAAALRPYLSSGIAFLLTTGLSLGFWSLTVSRYVAFDYQNTGFPTIHWVMMGARWDGAFDQMDELYTSGFDTREEKIEADKKVLSERLKEAGPAGLVALTGRKLLNTWADGTDNYQAENSYASYSKLYTYLLGSKSGFLTIYSQAFRALQMLALGFFALLSLIQLKKHRKLPKLFLIQLTFLGAMAFHILWETSPLYSIGFTFLGLMLLAEAVSSPAESRPLPLVFQKSWKVCGAASLLLLLLLILGKKELVDTPIEEQTYCIDQYQYAGGYDGYVKSYDQIYTQTFTTDHPFNRISIKAINPVGEYNQSAFCVKLTDEHGAILYDNDRFLSGMVVKNTPYEFVLDPVTPKGPTRYTLEITPGYIEGENSLEFLSYNTGNCDLYPGGSLTIGNQTQKKGDLAFSVYEYQVTTYFNRKVYLLLSAALLFLSAAITALMKRLSSAGK